MLLEKILTLPVLTVLILLGGWFFGRLFDRIKLPGVLGMVLFGIGIGFFLREKAPAVLWEIEPFLKSFALIVILLRAGLGISKETLKKAGITALLMAFVPCLLEGTALVFGFHYFFHFTWPVAGLTGFMLSAVSPAVIVPSMLDLKSRGYGQNKEVPTIVLAGASADDVIAITFFSLFLGLSETGQVNLLKTALSIPLSIIGGILPGIALGFILVLYFRKHHEKVRATEKVLILLTAAMLLVEAGNWFHLAALLGVMTVGFVLLEKAEVVAHELSGKLSRIWVFAQIILFVLIGFSVDLDVAFQAGLKGLLIIAGLVFRSAGVLIATAFSDLNRKERLFCVIAYIPKATVQAALGGVALSRGMAEGPVILAIAVLSIIFTAPLGLLGIRLGAPKLLEINRD